METFPLFVPRSNLEKALELRKLQLEEELCGLKKDIVKISEQRIMSVERSLLNIMGGIEQDRSNNLYSLKCILGDHLQGYVLSSFEVKPSGILYTYQRVKKENPNKTKS